MNADTRQLLIDLLYAELDSGPESRHLTAAGDDDAAYSDTLRAAAKELREGQELTGNV